MNAIEDMRERLRANFRGLKQPAGGLEFRPTANNMPRKPQSSIPSPKTQHDNVGRPPKREETPTLYRKKPRDIWGGWL